MKPYAKLFASKTIVWYKISLSGLLSLLRFLDLLDYSLKGGFMGRYKQELKRLHARKVRKAKEKIRLFYKGELPQEKLTALAKTFLARRKRQEKKPA
ncbi:MAG: hypothetical protein WCI77_04900 [Candidatus Omnitrophota bacterium]